MIWISTLTYFNNYNQAGKKNLFPMLNEGFKSKSSIHCRGVFCTENSVVARSWAHSAQSNAERQQGWDVFTNKLSCWLPSHTSCVTASTELSCCYWQPMAKLQQMQLNYTKLVLLCRGAWCNDPRGATQYWSAMKQLLCWGRAALQDLEPLHCMKPSAQRVYFTLTQKPAVRKERRNYSLPHRGECLIRRGQHSPRREAEPPGLIANPRSSHSLLPRKRIEHFHVIIVCWWAGNYCYVG